MQKTNSLMMRAGNSSEKSKTTVPSKEQRRKHSKIGLSAPTHHPQINYGNEEARCEPCNSLRMLYIISSATVEPQALKQVIDPITQVHFVY